MEEGRVCDEAGEGIEQKKIKGAEGEIRGSKQERKDEEGKE